MFGLGPLATFAFASLPATAYSVSLSETASAVDSPTSVTNATPSLSETASAVDSPSLGSFAVALTETASAVDTLGLTMAAAKSLAETASAVDTPGVIYHLSLSETGSAVATLSIALAAAVTLAESAAASDGYVTLAVITEVAYAVDTLSLSFPTFAPSVVRTISVSSRLWPPVLTGAIYNVFAQPTMLLWPRVKGPTAALDYSLDMTDDLTDPVTDPVVTIALTISPSGLGEMSASRLSINGNVLTVWFAGGVPGRFYTVDIDVRTVADRNFEYEIGLQIDATYAASPLPAPPETGPGPALLYPPNLADDFELEDDTGALLTEDYSGYLEQESA